jgi:hypothetical protein
MTNKQLFIERKKELIKSKSVSTINAWITQTRRSMNYDNTVCSHEFGIMDNTFAKENYKILDDEIYTTIITIINKNFKCIFWDLYFNNKTLNIPKYQDPYLNVYDDNEISEWDGELRFDTSDEFQELLKIFCVTYTISKKINVQDLPQVNIVLEFDMNNAMINLTKLKNGNN